MTQRRTRYSHIRTVLVTSIATLMVAVTGIPALGATDTEPVSVDLEAALIELMGLQPGGAVALTVRDGETIASATGFANADGDPMTIDSGFRVGWIGFGFVAAVVLQLVDEGRIDLDEPLSTYVPDTPLSADSTIRSLLTARESPINYLNELMYRWQLDPSRDWTVDDIIEIATELDRSDVTPDEGLSPTGYMLLVKLIEVLEGEVFHEVLDRRIAQPLGLDSTSDAGAPLPEGLSAGWYPDLGLEGQHDIGGMNSFAGVRTTAPDLARFVTALVDGEVVSPALVAEVFTEGDDILTLGGFFQPRQMRLGEPYFGWWQGDLSGYSFELIVDPDSGDTAIVLVNNIYVDTLPVVQKIVESWDAEGS